MELEVKVLEVEKDILISKLKKQGADLIFSGLTYIETYDFKMGFNQIASKASATFPNLCKIFEKINYLTTNHSNLANANAYLRLRQEGNKYEIILKYKIGYNTLIKEEEEISELIKPSEWQLIKDFFIESGMYCRFIQEKKRTSLVINHASKSIIRFDFDTFPQIPTYMEIESDSKDHIEYGLKLLGLTWSDTNNMTGKELFEYYNVNPEKNIFNEKKQDKIALITGSSSGIGFEICNYLLSNGYKIIALSRTVNKELLSKSNIYLMNFDLMDITEIDFIYKKLKDLGIDHIDLIINNAGIGPRTDTSNPVNNYLLGKLSYDSIIRYLTINAIAPLLIVQNLLNLIKSSNQCKIVNISSRYGSITNKNTGSNYGYSASKSLLNMFTRILSIDLNKYGIVVIAVHPGTVKTKIGGDNADLSAKESVSMLFSLINDLAIQDSGKFYSITKEELPW